MSIPNNDVNNINELRHGQQTNLKLTAAEFVCAMSGKYIEGVDTKKLLEKLLESGLVTIEEYSLLGIRGGADQLKGIITRKLNDAARGNPAGELATEVIMVDVKHEPENQAQAFQALALDSKFKDQVYNIAVSQQSMAKGSSY